MPPPFCINFDPPPSPPPKKSSGRGDVRVDLMDTITLCNVKTAAPVQLAKHGRESHPSIVVSEEGHHWARESRHDEGKSVYQKPISRKRMHPNVAQYLTKHAWSYSTCYLPLLYDKLPPTCACPTVYISPLAPGAGWCLGCFFQWNVSPNVHSGWVNRHWSSRFGTVVQGLLARHLHPRHRIHVAGDPP